MRKIFQFLESFFLSNQFFAIIFTASVSFVLSMKWPIFYTIGLSILGLLLLGVFFDIARLYGSKNPFLVDRSMADKLSNGDKNHVYLTIENSYPFTVHIKVIDEIPVQLQQRHFSLAMRLHPNQSKMVNYEIQPKERGVYTYRKVNLFAETTFPRLVRRKFKLLEDQDVKVYPSIIQMKRYQFLAISNQLKEYGIKKLRKIGQSQEFEQIREYVTGDDYRNINWKATGRKNQLMVNEYIDERAQRVYSIIDKGRVMQMPFEGLSLLDYSINSCLALSNVVYRHQNKPGLITFSKDIESFVLAEKKASQMFTILEQLYAQKTNFEESNYERLFLQIRKRITQRSLLLFFTNFENRNALYRQIKFLRTLSQKHVVVTIFFENTELIDLANSQPKSLQDIYDKTLALQYQHDKKFIVNELNRNGIHTVLTAPKDLSVNTINKYLDLRSRGLIN